MKYASSQFRIQRTVVLGLLSFAAVAAVLVLAVSAKRRHEASSLSAGVASPPANSVPDVALIHTQGKKPLAPQAAVVAATLTDNVSPGTKVAPGGTINYTAVISNTGAASPGDDATAVQFSAALDANTTFVNNSAHASPIATNNAYTTVANTLLEAGVAASGNPAVTSAVTLFTNDTIATAPDTIQLASFTAASANGGTVSVNADGSFTYLPPIGFTGSDTFTYTIRNSADATLTDTGTVTVTVGAPRVWYVNNSGANGDGRSTSPFNTLANAAAVDAAGDIIYIFTGSGNYTGGITLLNNEQVIGNGVALVVNTFTLRAVGSRPTVVNAGGAGMTLGQNNTLTGFNFGACTGFAITGTSVGTLTVSTMLINNTSGGALDLTGVSTPTVSVVLDSTNSTGGTSNVRLVGLNGTVTLGSGALSGSTAGATNHAFSNSGGNAGITFTGSITKANQGNVVNIASRTGGTVTLSGTINGSSSNGINVSSNTGGTINFSGATKTLNTAANAAVTLATNTGVIINFSGGGLDIDTTSGGGFTATGGGTIAVTTGANPNTIDSTTGTALKVTSTTIGASGLTFRSISANGAANGIFLDGTGAGGLTVTGNGSTCTFATPTCDGGRIQSTAGADNTTNGIGVYLQNAQNVSLTRMRIDNHPNFAIRGHVVNNFTLQNVVIDGNNGTNSTADTDIVNGEDSVRIINLTGSALIDNSFIGGGYEQNLRVVNDTGSLNRLTVSNCSIGDLDGAGAGRGVDSADGDDNITFSAADGALTQMNGTFTNNILNNGRGDVFQAVNNDVSAPAAAMDIVFRGNSVSNNHPVIVIAGGGVTFNGTGAMTYDISCNKFRDSKGHGLNVFKQRPASGQTGGTWSGTIFNNRIGVSGVGDSGGLGNGLNVEAQGNGTHTTLIKNNQVFNWNSAAVKLSIVDANTSGPTALTMNATVIGNSSSQPDPVNAFAGFHAVQGAVNPADATTTLNLKLGGAGAEQNTFVDGDPGNANDVALQRATSPQIGTLNLTQGASGANTPVETVVQNNNSSPITVFADTGITVVGTVPALPAVTDQTCTPPPIPNPDNQAVTPKYAPVNHWSTVANTSPTQPDAVTDSLSGKSFLGFDSVDSPPLPVESVRTEIASSPSIGTNIAPQRSAGRYLEASNNEQSVPTGLKHQKPGFRDRRAETRSNHAVRSSFNSAPAEQGPNAPLANLPVTVGTLPAGKSVTIKYQVTVNSPPLVRSVSSQGTVTGNGPGAFSVMTDDTDLPGAPLNPTVTLIDTLMTWNGATSTDWNTATNWTQPAGGTQYAPGVSNPAVNDVVIPNVGAQPNIGVSDIGVFSLNISNGRTLTISTPRVLTIGGSPGGDLTLDGIISGGNLNLGTGTHVINNAGGSGSLSSTNVATVLSGGTVTLNNNLQVGALAVNAGGSMNITNRTLGLNASGAALVIPGGATFTTTGSAIVFNGTAAQTAAGIAYNNLTINNTIGTNVTGVTLTGNATVNGTLVLTSSDLDTGAFTLTQPNTTASTGASDVVGTVSRTGGPFAIGTPLTFGNPNNRLTITAGATRPTTVTFGIAKAAPINPNGYAAAVQRTYTISQTAGSGFTSTLQLHYLDSELNGNTEASLNLRRLRTSDNHWTVHLPTTLDGANNWVQSTGVLDTELSTRWTMSSLAPTASNGMVTGRITDAQGRPVEGAVVRLSGAQERKFITDANGYYRFDNVETGEFYTVTPSRVNYHFNPFNRSFSQTGNQTQAVFTAESMGDGANPLDTAEYFVRQQYVDVLGREPEETGFNYWSDKILGCGEDVQCVNTQRREVAAAFFIAEENQASGVFIYDAYAGALGRRPTFAEFTVDRTHVVGGGTLDADKTAFAQSFVQRAEFMTKYQNASSADAFVDALLQSVRGTGADLSSERTNLIDIYSQGADQVSSRAAVLRSIADNATFKQSQYNPAFVLTEYFAYLRRDAESEGFNFWVGVLNTGDAGNYRGMVCSFVTSREYQNRFSQIVSHANGECSMP